MNGLQQAAQYWKDQLSAGKPIYRVRVRKLLQYAGAERRGWTILRRIGETLEGYGLATEPDFRTAWIDGLVSVYLVSAAETEPHRSIGIAPETFGMEPGLSLGDPGADDPEGFQDSTPIAQELNAPDSNDGIVHVPSSTETSPQLDIQIDPVRKIGSLASANRGAVSVLLSDTLQTATTTMIFEGYSQVAIMQGERNVRGVISWESIAKRSLSTPAPTSVSDCRADAQVIEADAALFDAPYHRKAWLRSRAGAREDHGNRHCKRPRVRTSFALLCVH